MLEHIVMGCCEDGLWSTGVGGEQLSVMLSVTENTQVLREVSEHRK